MKAFTNQINILLAIASLLFVSLGCLGPSADSDRCTGTLKARSKTYVGASKTEDQAALNSCNKFCSEEDAEFDAMYGIWLTSATAKGLEKLHGEKPSKHDAMMEDKGLLDFVTKNCAPRCVKEANKGNHTLETSCRK